MIGIGVGGPFFRQFLSDERKTSNLPPRRVSSFTLCCGRPTFSRARLNIDREMWGTAAATPIIKIRGADGEDIRDRERRSPIFMEAGGRVQFIKSRRGDRPTSENPKQEITLERRDLQGGMDRWIMALGAFQRVSICKHWQGNNAATFYTSRWCHSHVPTFLEWPDGLPLVPTVPRSDRDFASLPTLELGGAD